jgi:hypothetical protein
VNGDQSISLVKSYRWMLSVYLELDIRFMKNDWFYKYEYQDSQGSICSGLIRLKNVPDLLYQDDQWNRSYLYEFRNALPEQDFLNQFAKHLYKKFLLRREINEFPKDIEAELSVVIDKESEHEAKVITITTSPEEDCVYLYALHTLPKLIEQELGTIHKIQNQPREAWIY